MKMNMRPYGWLRQLVVVAASPLALSFFAGLSSAQQIIPINSGGPAASPFVADVNFSGGATIDHALWALIHDLTHNLAFRSRSANRITSIVANLPLVVPGAISFAKYHLLHHRHMGDLEFDAGVPGPTEARCLRCFAWPDTPWLETLKMRAPLAPGTWRSGPAHQQEARLVPMAWV